MQAKTILQTTIVSLVAAGVVLALPLLGGAADSGSTPDPQPANKVAVAGSTIEIFSAPVVDGSSSTIVTLLSTSIKTSPPTDLIFSLTMECSILTSVMTIGNDMQQAHASIQAWVEIDGVPVPVAADDAGEDGEVVFCDRLHRQTTMTFDDEDATIEQFLKTRAANAFNWVATDVGGGTHTIEVKALLKSDSTSGGMAAGVVGQRTLIVDPIKLPTGTTF